MLDHSCGVNRAPLSERRDDCYDTPPVAVEALLKVEKVPELVWEPCCGTGNIVGVLRTHGHTVVASDLNDRGCPDSVSGVDFLFPPPSGYDSVDAIVTNPPYSLAIPFIETALARAPLVIMLLRLQFFESERRTPILEGRGLARIHVFRKRLPMMHRAGWEGKKANSGMAFSWWVWERGYDGPTIIDRISWEAERSAPRQVKKFVEAGPLFDWPPAPDRAGPFNCDLWPECGCGTQSGPHACEGRPVDTGDNPREDG